VKLGAVISAHTEVSEAARQGRDCSDALRELDATLKSSKLEYLQQQIPRAIQQSLEGLGQVSSIVKAMKEFSHPSGGEKQPVDIHDIIESTTLVAKNEWKYVADLELSFDWTLPPVLVLRNELSQVLLNLIVNAAHAIGASMPEGAKEKGKITITTSPVDEAVEIRVSDTGGGIPTAVQPHIFEPFFTTKEVGKGTGQGLAICYSVIVDRHHGHISFETEAGRGTTFVIRLPMPPAEAALAEVLA
ncbi:MAG TPA: ATP-binding protein, partial [Polyangiaceae bacterium]|nr:ATP-binding protein [Polyangiaceae bacterium]